MNSTDDNDKDSAYTCSYDQVLCYAFPVIMAVTIFICWIRIYFVHIRPHIRSCCRSRSRPRRDRDTVQNVHRGAATISTIYQDMLIRVPPPPNYQQTLKNDRRTASRTAGSISQPAEIVVESLEPSSDRPRRNAIGRTLSNIEEGSPPADNLGPPAYSQRVSTENLNSEVLSSPQRERLPTYEEAVIENSQSRRPVLNV